MADAYRQVLDRVVAAVTGLTSTGSRVYESPADAIAAAQLPALAVQPVLEEVSEFFEDTDDRNHLERHRLTVAVQSIARTAAERDTSAGEVKKALAAVMLGWSQRFVTAEFDARSDGERKLYGVSQKFAIEFHVEASIPDVVIAS